jgi:hypothetical protein
MGAVLKGERLAEGVEPVACGKKVQLIFNMGPEWCEVLTLH